jgi:putative transposase
MFTGWLIVSLGPRKAELVLSTDEQARLQLFARSRTSSSSLAMRAKLILACAAGATNTEVAKRYAVSRFMVGKWRARFVEHRVEGLFDDFGGRPRFVEQEARVAEVVAEMRRKELEAGPIRWNVREIAKKTGIPRTSIYTYLKRLGVRIGR